MEKKHLHYAKYGEDPLVWFFATDDPSNFVDFDTCDFKSAKCVAFVDILEEQRQFDFALQVIDWRLQNGKRIMLIPSVVPKALLPTIKEHTIKSESSKCNIELISTALAASGGWGENVGVGSIYLPLPTFPQTFNDCSLNYAVYNTLRPTAQRIADRIRTLDLSELETIIWIDNWMQQNIQYIKNRETNGPGGDNDVYICEDITKQAIVPDVLLHHYGVCEDIAVSVATIASLLDIDCAVMQGGAHAWNLITLDGKAYVLDSTRNITRNPNRMANALKATKYTSRFTLVGDGKERATYVSSEEIGIRVSCSDFPREEIEKAVSKLKSKGVLFEYDAQSAYKSIRGRV